MRDSNTEQWTELNKQYLIAAINMVKAELLEYANSKEAKDTPPQPENTVENAAAELSRLEEAFPDAPALNILAERFQLSSFEKKMLLMCAGVELDAQFAQLIYSVQSNSSQLPTFSLALSTFPDAHWSALTPEGPLRYWTLIELSKPGLLTQATYTIDEYILHYLTGINALDHRLDKYVKFILPEGGLAPSHKKIADELAWKVSHFSQTGNYPLILLRGNNTEDKLAIAAEAFHAHLASTFQLQLSFLPSNFSDITELVKIWNRSAALNRYVLFLDHSRQGSLDEAAKHRLYYMVENIHGVVVLDSSHKFTDLKRSMLAVDVEKPLREEQHKIWKQQLGPIAEEIDDSLDRVTTQFDLASHTIKKLAHLVFVGNGSNGSDKISISKAGQQVWELCCHHTRPDLDELAQRIESLATWEDLVLPEFQKAILKEIVVQVQQRQKVYYEWRFAGKSNRGLGISTLFSGESGTGKTMASEVLANALQLDLYRIDLSQIVNKYIGETEKNLKKVFDAAEGSNAILLFDEADALFGKRSDVKDSHDRHANIEVSYLLQKMEEYKGLAILTTNMKTALDRAFLRRIRFMVQFPFPDARMRAEIWNSVFPEETPTHGLNIQKLAALNIAGGNIRNIALNASFAAAGKNQPVTMKDIHRAARNEYQKLEKQMSTAESIL